MLNNPLLPTAYLAPVKYYAILLQAKNCSIEHHEHFIKQSIRNRCEIYGANGELRLTIPKERKGSSKTIISEIKISYKDDWQKLHWNAIKSAYNSSPFFEYYSNELEVFYQEKESNLIIFNNKLQEVILDLLQEENNSTPTVEYLHSGNFTDLRNHDFTLEDPEKYNQVFMEKHGFIPNLSILDLLFNLGPESLDYLHNLDISI
ncbi:MAG: WbqC family protein [Flavobacteriales bacterium]|nr:WbqC family protein [Flavobacteriales bacterium]